MPTYQYECAACHHSFEILQSMTDKKLQKCPKCKKSKLQRLIGTGSGIIFKGSGFYETDYKRKGETTAQSSSKPSPAPNSCGSGCGCHPSPAQGGSLPTGQAGASGGKVEPKK